MDGQYLSLVHQLTLYLPANCPTLALHIFFFLNLFEVYFVFRIQHAQPGNTLRFSISRVQTGLVLHVIITTGSLYKTFLTLR